MNVKGVADLYDLTCNDLSEEPFVQWIKDQNPSFRPGQICSTVAWYVKRKRWYLEEAIPNPTDEPQSTWFARVLNKHFPDSNSHFVMKYFELERDERLITTNSKERPVILLRATDDDWWNPGNQKRHVKYWLTVPLFSYKPRHSQEYVLQQQRLRSPDAFYIPPAYSGAPGINNESAARFHAIQMTPESNLTPLKCMCNDPPYKMGLPFGLSATGLRLFAYHYYKNFGIFPELEDPETEYSLFVEQINDLLDQAVE